MSEHDGGIDDRWMDRYLVENLIKAKAYKMVIRYLHRVLDDATRSPDLEHRKWLIEHLCRAYIGDENEKGAKEVIERLDSEYPDDDTNRRELRRLVKGLCHRKTFGA